MLSPPRMSYLSPLYPHHHLLPSRPTRSSSKYHMPSLIPPGAGLSPHCPEASVIPLDSWGQNPGPQWPAQGLGTEQAVGEGGEGASAPPRKEGSRWDSAHLSHPGAQNCFSGGRTLPWLRGDLKRREVTAHAPPAGPQRAQRGTADGQVGVGAALTWGRACTTVSSRARIPVAIFRSFSTAGNTQPGPLSPDQRGQACASVCV